MKNVDLFEKYLKRELPKEELKSFKERLLTDAAFNLEFHEFKMMREAIKRQARLKTLAFFEEIEHTTTENKPTKDHIIMKRFISMAASIVLIATLGFIGLQELSSNNSLENIFQENYTPYANLSGQVRGDVNEEASALLSAMSAYDAKDFETAANELRALLATEESAFNYFYLGMSNIEIGKMESAIDNFNTVLNNYNTFSEQARWYLSLAHLKNKDEEAAISGFVTMKMKETEFSARAQSILNEMGVTVGDDIDTGPIVHVVQRPKDIDSPDGSMEDFKGKRRYQFGVVADMGNSKEYRFLTDQPIEDLHEGDLAIYVIVDRSKGKGRGQGYAVLLDKY